MTSKPSAWPSSLARRGRSRAEILRQAVAAYRDAILDALASEPGRLPAPTTAEIDCLLGQRFGSAARRAFLSDLATGRFAVASLERGGYATVPDLEAATATSTSASPTAL